MQKRGLQSARGRAGEAGGRAYVGAAAMGVDRRQLKRATSASDYEEDALLEPPRTPPHYRRVNGQGQGSRRKNTGGRSEPWPNQAAYLEVS